MEPLISTNASLLPESQATQIVREALRGGVNIPKPIAQEEPEVYVEDKFTPSDVKSTPHYHYHGLAVTQSPSQPGGHGGEDSQDSQATSHSSVTGPNAVSMDHLVPPLSPKSPSNANGPPGTPSPSKPGKAVSFVSPHRPPITPLRKSRSLHTPAHRSPSPQSQDSFAGSIPINPQAAFLAKSKRFGLPLSQLEDSPEDSMFSPYPSKPKVGPSLVVGMSQSSSDESNSQNTQQVVLTQEESQPQATEYPQEYMEYLTCAGGNRIPYIDRSGLNFPQSPGSSSSSSGNFPENETRPDEEPTQISESTQPGSDEAPTQPSTQVAAEAAAEEPTQTDAPSDTVPPSVDSHQTPAASTVASSTNNRSLHRQVKPWRKFATIPHPRQGPPTNRGQSPSVVPETQPFGTESTETRPTGDGGVETTLDAPEPPPARSSPPDSPLRSLQPMPPPPPPPRVDEDETMDIVPDSEPSRVSDGPMSSLHLPGLESRVPDIMNDEGEILESAMSDIINGRKRIVPKSSGNSDTKVPEHNNPDRSAEDAKDHEAETEKEDDPMDSQPLVRQRPKRPPKPVLEEEDEDEDEVRQEVRDNTVVPETEDEAPLATVVKPTKAAPKPLPPRGRSMRNKRPIIYTESPDTSENDEEEEEPEETPVERATKKRKIEKADKVGTDVTPVTTRGRGRKLKQPASAKAVKGTTKGSTMKAKPQKGRGRGKKTPTEASIVGPSRRDTSPAQEDEAKTEPAEDDEEEAGPESSDDVPLARKRKRPGLDQKPHRTASGSSALQGITPQRAGSKRIRSLPGSLRDIAQNDCTRVFAQWPLCKHFYAGFVHSRSPVQSDLYVVRFDDGTECPVHISNIRQSELEVGDEVFVIGYKQPGQVTAIDRWEGERYVRVRVETGGELDIKSNAIKIHESVIDRDWVERPVHENSICTLLQAQGLNASTSKSTAVNGTSTSKFLKRIGFVVTMKSGDKSRTHIFDLIKSNGGKVIDDWANLFPFSPSQTDRTWVARNTDVKHKDLGLQTVFLLADEPNQKPKYLVALALGIPCVSTQWLLDCQEQHALISWTSYLLPAGEYTHGLMSQRVNLRWGDKSRQFHEIYRDMYGSNSILYDKSVLCIGLELFPPGRTKGLKRINSDDDKQNESTRKLPSIILAMGADQVEAVWDVKHASSKTTEYDYVLVKDLEEVKKFKATRKGDQPPCFHIPWVKECLVAGKFLDLPKA